MVKTILVNNGYDVIDLGKQVPAETIISKAEEKADAMGKCAAGEHQPAMPQIINELDRRGLEIPVLTVAQPLTPTLATYLTESGHLIQQAFSGKDAFEAW